MAQQRPLRSWHLPLRVHLLLLVAGTLIPVLLLSGILVNRLVSDSRSAVERRLLAVARTQATIIDAELSATIRALQALASSTHLDTDDLPAFYTQAARGKMTQASWLNVILSLPNGRQLLNTARPWGTMGLPMAADAESIERVVSRKLPVVGSLRRGPVDRRLAVPIRVPVIREGQVRYVLTAVLTSEALSTLVRGAADLDVKEWTRGIVDGDGVVVARTRDSEQFVGRRATHKFIEEMQRAREGVYADESLDGQAVYAAFSRAPMSGWTAAIAVQRSVLEAPLRQSMIALGSLGLLLVALGGLGAFVVSRRISGDIAAAALAAEALADGRAPALSRSIVTEVRSFDNSLSKSAALLDAHGRARDQHLRQVEAARAEAEAADRAKDDFLAMLGHELRNPLAPVLTALQLMRMRGDATALREREVIERQVRHLARLVDDLLDVSRLRGGKIVLRRARFELVAAVQRAMEIAEPLIAERGHEVSVDVPETGLVIDGDETRIAQVLANLLNNAAKYTDFGGQITLSARAEDGCAVIECRDNGTGIAPELLPRLFQLFAQGERSLDRGMGGLGLGLAVAKSLTELHGGTVEATSAGPGRGSQFTVSIPLAEAAVVTAGADHVTVPVPVSRAARVLVVDDNRDALEMLSVAFEFAGFTVRGAGTGEKALAVAAEFVPHVAVLDIGLPGMDGYELARRLGAMDGGTMIRLVALTGYGQDTDIAAAYGAGFHLHMVKPADIDALIEFISISTPDDQR